MKKQNNIAILAPVLMILVVCFTFYITYFRSDIEVMSSRTVEMTYETSLFDENRVQFIEIIMDESSWDDMLENATKEQFYACDVIVNGVTYKNVGIRPKGNTSLTMIASDNTTNRYSFKIDFGKYIDGQTCDGLDVLLLNNMMSDATYMKEYLSYDLFQFMSVNSSLTAFMDVKVNGEEWGLYLGIEGLEQSFAQRNYSYSHGNLYKVESENLVGGGGNFDKGNFDRENINNKNFASPNDLDSEISSSSSGADLAYIDDEVENYSAIFNNAVFDIDNEDKKAVIEALKNMNNGTELEKYVDVDQLLRYIAVNVILVNLDSYFGNMLHNYYLYEENGQLAMVPWDYNLAFAGFQSNDVNGAVNLAIDTVVSGVNLEDRPIIAKLLEVEEYKEKYHEYLQQIVTEYFESGYFTNKIQYVDTLISSYVEKDATAFYSYEEYKTGVNTLMQFGLLRSQSIQGQLDGIIPSTEEEQKNDASNLVDASNINLSNMGSMMGGGGKMPQMPEGIPEGENGEMPQMPEGIPESENAEIPTNTKPANKRGNANRNDMKENFERENIGMKQNLGISQYTQYSESDLILIGGSFIVAIGGIIFVKMYKKRKYRTE